MLQSESARCAVFTSSSDSLLFGAKWRSQSSVRESNVTRQRTLHRVNSSTSDECDECDACDECDESNEKKSNSDKMKQQAGGIEKKEEEEEESDLMARQLVSNGKSQCPVEMQSTKKLFLVNLSPATHETATIDANVCALRHGRCDDESTKLLMTVDLHSRQQEEEEEDEETQSDEQVQEEEGNKQDGNGEVKGEEGEEEMSKKKVVCEAVSFRRVARKSIVKKTREENRETSDSQSQVKCDCLSTAVSDKSNEFDASESVRYFMSNFVHRIFCG